jgi:hypothetical protein
MLRVNAPIKMPTTWASGAKPGYIRTIGSPSLIGKNDGAASYTDGFPPLTFTPVAAGGVPPYGADMNGILNQMTQWEQWAQVGGPIRYDAIFQSAVGGYPAEARVGSNTTTYLIWQSTADNNVTNPDTGTTVNWQTPVFPDVSNATKMNPGLTITGASTLGANLAFVGNGTVAPRKWLRVWNGNLSVMNNANLNEIFTLNDAGDLSNLRNITAAGNVSTLNLSVSGSTTTGDITASGDVTASGKLTGASLAVTGAATVGTSLTVGGATTLNNTLTVASATTLKTTLTVTGVTTLNSSLAVTGATALSGTLAVTGAATLSNNLTVTGTTQTGALTVNTTANVVGAATLRGTLAVTGATTLSSTLAVTGAATLSSTLAVTGAATLSSTLRVNGEIFAGFVSGSSNNSVIRFRSSSTDTGGTGYIFRDNTAGVVTISASNTGGQGLDIDGSGNITATGSATITKIFYGGTSLYPTRNDPDAASWQFYQSPDTTVSPTRHNLIEQFTSGNYKGFNTTTLSFFWNINLGGGSSGLKNNMNLDGATGNLQARGTVHGTNVILMEQAIERLTVRLNALDGETDRYIPSIPTPMIDPIAPMDTNDANTSA